MLYAVAKNGMADVADIIRPMAKKYDVSFSAVGMDNDFSKAQCYLVMGFSALKKHKERFVDKKVAVIVFDAPPRLMDLKPDEWLDCKTPTQTYRFIFQPLDKSNLREIIKRLATGKEGKFDRNVKSYDVLPAILNSVDLEGVINRFNDLIMHGVARVNRDRERKNILTVLYGRKKLDWLPTKFAETKSKTVKELRAGLMAALASEEGQKLCSAVQASEKMSVEKAAEKFKVDVKNLRYISKAKQSLNKIGMWDKK